MNDRIDTILRETLGIMQEQITPAAKLLEDLHADSLDKVELTLSFEEAFGIALNDSDIDEATTVADLYRVVGAAVAAKAAA